MRRLGGVLLVAALGLAACGNDVTAEVSGTTAVTVDGAGAVTVLVAACGAPVDRIAVFADRDGLADDEPNPELGSWTAAVPQKGLVVLPLDAPGSEWSGSDPVSFVDHRGYVVIADQAEAHVEAEQVDFRGSDLVSLTPDRVLVGDRETDDRGMFEASCS